MRTISFIFDNTDKNKDLLYLSKIPLKDNVLAYKVEDKFKTISGIYASSYEKELLLTTSKFNEVYILSEWNGNMLDLFTFIMNKYECDNIIINNNFNLNLYEHLKLNYNITIKENILFEERYIKTEEEIKNMIDISDINTIVMDKVKTILIDSQIKNNKLLYKNTYLTSEYLREFIEIECLKNGARGDNPIVSIGDQCTDCHYVGTGLLRPNQSIIIDIFPKMIKTGYYSDMTRTFVKGSPSDELRKLIEDVKNCQNVIIDDIKINYNMDEYYNKSFNFFSHIGYKTSFENNFGYIHGLGHGIGLDLHESSFNSIIKENMTLAIEPGLYYKGLGGARFEDTIIVRNKKCYYLTTSSEQWLV